jgi:hypothetical protein
MKKWLWLFLLVPILSWAQYPSLTYHGALTVSGGSASNCLGATPTAGSCINIPNLNGAYGATFEEIPVGSPSAVSVTVQGCMYGGTCDSAADTNTSTSAANRGVTFSKVYNFFIIVGTFSGGTTPSIKVNTTVSAAANHSGNGSFTAAGDLSGTSTSQEVIGLLDNALPGLTTGFLNWTGSAWALSAAGSGTINNAAQYGETYYSASGTTNTLSGLAAPTTNGTYYQGYSISGGAAAAPTNLQLGIGGRAITGAATTDTILYSDAGGVIDHDQAASGTLVETIPTTTTLGNTTFGFKYCNQSAQTDTVKATTFTIQVNSSAAVAGATGFTVASEACYLIKVDPNNATQWLANGGSAGAGTVTSFSSGNLSPLFTTSVATQTTTPAQTFSLSNAGVGTFLGNNTSAAAGPAYVTLSAVNPQTATYQVLASDFSAYKTITVASGTFTITLVASGAQPTNGQYISIVNYGSGVVTIARSGQNINGAAANLTLNAGSAANPTGATVWSDGTNYFAAVDEDNSNTGTVTSVAASAPLGGGTITTSGTLTCTTCTTNAAAATSNHVMVGGGSQAIVAATNTTDDNTTFTTTDTSGVKSPVFTSTGNTAGFIDFPQGSDSGSVAPCSTANSICEEAPTSVTAQKRIKAGAPGTGFTLWTNSSGTMSRPSWHIGNKHCTSLNRC